MRTFCVATFLLLLILSLGSTAAAAINIDGVISPGEWDGFIIVDPEDNTTPPIDPARVEMTRWGAKVEGSYLYWFCEIGDDLTFDAFALDEGGDTEVYPAIWIDFDNSTTTYLKDGTTSNAADHAKKEWGTQLGGAGNHRGIDLDIEWGSDMAGTGNYVNYWGDAGDVGSVISGGAVATWSMGVGRASNVIECKVSISDIATALTVAGNTEAGGIVTMDPDYWTVAVAIQGEIKSGYGYPPFTWGYDVGTPTAIAVNAAVNPLIPGDANLDGIVDGDDLATVASKLRQHKRPGMEHGRL